MSQQGPVMHDGEEEYPLPTMQNTAPPQFGKKDSALNTEIVGLVRDARGSIQASSVVPLIAALRGGGGGNENNEINNQMVGMFTTLSTTLTNLVSAEREARQRAEAATNQAQQQYFTSQAEMIKQLYDKASKPPELPKTMSDLENYKSWNNLITEAAKTLVPAPAVAQTGATPLDLELKKLDLDNQRLTLQMQHAHDLALRDMDLKMANFNLELAKFTRGEQSKTSWLDEVLQVLGMAVAQGAKPDGAAPGIGAPTPGGLLAAECDSCHQKMFYPPNAEYFSCGKCGMQYRTKQGPETGPGAGSRPQPPIPPEEVSEEDERRR